MNKKISFLIAIAAGVVMMETFMFACDEASNNQTWCSSARQCQGTTAHATSTNSQNLAVWECADAQKVNRLKLSCKTSKSESATCNDDATQTNCAAYIKCNAAVNAKGGYDCTDGTITSDWSYKSPKVTGDGC